MMSTTSTTQAPTATAAALADLLRTAASGIETMDLAVEGDRLYLDLVVRIHGAKSIDDLAARHDVPIVVPVGDDDGTRWVYIPIPGTDPVKTITVFARQAVTR